MIHEEEDFESDRAQMGSQCSFLSVGFICSHGLKSLSKQCVEPRIRVAVWMKGDRRGQSCSSRVGK